MGSLGPPQAGWTVSPSLQCRGHAWVHEMHLVTMYTFFQTSGRVLPSPTTCPAPLVESKILRQESSLCCPQLGGPRTPPSLPKPSGGGLGQHLPATRAAVLAEVCAWLAGGQLQQLRPFPLPLLLRVHQPWLAQRGVGLGGGVHLFTPAPTSVWPRARLPDLVNPWGGHLLVAKDCQHLLWTEFVQNPQSPTSRLLEVHSATMVILRG